MIRRQVRRWVIDNETTMTKFAGSIGYSNSYLSVVDAGCAPPSRHLIIAVRNATNGEVDWTNRTPHDEYIELMLKKSDAA